MEHWHVQEPLKMQHNVVGVDGIPRAIRLSATYSGADSAGLAAAGREDLNRQHHLLSLATVKGATRTRKAAATAVANLRNSHN